MIIYNVTNKVAGSIVADWLKWMKEEHIPDLMNTGLLEQDEAEGPTYIVQYFADSMEHYNTYISEHAPLLRDKAYKKFGDKIIAFRTIMAVEA